MYTFVLLCQFFFSALSFRDTNNDHEDENDDSDNGRNDAENDDDVDWGVTYKQLTCYGCHWDEAHPSLCSMKYLRAVDLDTPVLERML